MDASRATGSSFGLLSLQQAIDSDGRVWDERVEVWTTGVVTVEVPFKGMADLVADLLFRLGSQCTGPALAITHCRCTQCCRYPQTQRAQDPPSVGQVQLSDGQGGSVVETGVFLKFGLNFSPSIRRDVGQLEPCTCGSVRCWTRDARYRVWCNVV